VRPCQWTNLCKAEWHLGNNRRKETVLAWESEPGAGSRGRQNNGEPEPPAEEDDRFLDHHIEEMLGALSHAAATRESRLGDGMERTASPTAG
jgi:hypothetical protein